MLQVNAIERNAIHGVLDASFKGPTAESDAGHLA